MANRRNQIVVEDCIKVIYRVGRTVTEIAGQLRASTSRTSSLIRRLSDDRLVEHERYGTVALTPAGEALALRIVRRHRLIETFLVEYLDYSWDQVHDEAEILEHTISDFMLDRIDRSLGRPWRDPTATPSPPRAASSICPWRAPSQHSRKESAGTSSASSTTLPSRCGGSIATASPWT